MTQKQIAQRLTDVLIGEEPMSTPLFEQELAELVVELRESMVADDDDFIFSITNDANDVAMLLIARDGSVSINEAARVRLMNEWQRSYASNMEMLIPDFAEQLYEGEIPVNGVKVSRGGLSEEG